MPNLATIRRTVLKRLGWYENILATSGTTLTIVDTDKLKDSGESIYTYEDKWVIAIGGTSDNRGRVRRVDSYSPASGTLTLGSPFPQPVAAFDSFIVSDISPTLVDDAINDALRKCTTVRWEPITYTTGQKQVDLTSLYSWITQRDQVLGFRYRLGTVTNQYDYQYLSPYEYNIFEDFGSVWASFRASLMTPGTGLLLEIGAIASFGSDDIVVLSSDTDSTVCPLDWIVPMAIVEVLERIAKSADLMGRVTLKFDLNAAIQEATNATAQFAPKINYPIRIEE